MSRRRKESELYLTRREALKVGASYAALMLTSELEAAASGLNNFAISNQALPRSHYFAYAVNKGSNTVSLYWEDPLTGLLTPIKQKTVVTGSSPASVVVDPTGQFMYVAN